MITPTQSRMARAALGWTVRDLAKAAEVAVATVNRFEMGHAVPNRLTAKAIQQTFETAGIRFTDHGVELPPRTPSTGS